MNNLWEWDNPIWRLNPVNPLCEWWRGCCLRTSTVHKHIFLELFAFVLSSAGPSHETYWRWECVFMKITMGLCYVCVHTFNNLCSEFFILWSRLYSVWVCVCTHPLNRWSVGGQMDTPFWPVHLQVTWWSVNLGINLCICVCVCWREINIPARSGASSHLPVLLTTQIPLI